MRDYIESLWDRLRSSYWFIPAVMMVIAIFLSVIMVQLDQVTDDDIAWIGNIVYVDSAEGAREVLSAIASSMITVAGVVFSITMVVLSLTSQQFGPLVLINFLRDRGNQLVLGTFVSTFVYCLLVLRTISGSDTAGFVPRISVLLGIGLAIASIGVLIYFIHHVATTIQPTHILATLAHNLNKELQTLFPEGMGQALAHLPAESLDLEALDEKNLYKQSVTAAHAGYIRTIHKDHLFDEAVKHECIVRVEHDLGYFIVQGEVLATVWFKNAEDAAPVREKLRNAFVIGISRTQNQDVAFMFVQLVEIALRALSPALNDPFTAMMCVDRLKEALIVVAERNTPSPYRFDEQHNLRVIAPVTTFAALIDLSYLQIIDYAGDNRKMLSHLLATLDDIRQHAQEPADKAIIARYSAYVQSKLGVFETV